MAIYVERNAEISRAFAEVLKVTPIPRHLLTFKEFASALQDKKYRDAVGEGVFSSLLMVMAAFYEELKVISTECQETVAMYMQLTAESFRALRNACIQNPGNQNLLRRLGFIVQTVKVINALQTLNVEILFDIFQPICFGIQFLGNIAVGNQMSKDDIWQLCFPKLFQVLLSVNRGQTVEYTSMVLYNCLDEAKMEKLSELQNIPLALRVIELYRTHSHCDWIYLIATEHILKSSALVETMYSCMTHSQRVTLLELISAQLKGEDPENVTIPHSVAPFLACSFQISCQVVLKLATHYAYIKEVQQEAQMVIHLLEVLCEMTSDRKRFMFLQDHPDLLEEVVDLLKQVHAKGKGTTNIFSSSRNFSISCEVPSLHSQVMGFKSHLIRLIGNLCHSNTNNQNKVRDLDGIPLILDNCIIDSNNPFICQWAIFAIRNLLEHNTKNQELVGSVERSGTADYSMLKELGFLVEERDGSLLLKPVPKDS